MDTPALPRTVASASPSASAKNEGLREAPYAMPSMNKLEASPPPVTLAVAAAAGAPTETVERPAEHTLARGKYETKPGYIAAIGVSAVLFLVVWSLLRVRRAGSERRRAAALRATLPRG
jgi:hypothetical protein